MEDWKKQDRNLQDQYFGKNKDQKMQDRNTEDHFEGLENAGPENRGLNFEQWLCTCTSANVTN